MIDPDEPLRVAAFAAIEKLTRQWAGRIPWNVIKSGFRAADGTQIRFAGLANGIFKPKQMSAALSIKTTVPRAGRSPWCRDQDSDSANLDHDTGLIRYDLARGGLNDPTNRAIRDAMRRRAPLIYFIGLAPGREEQLGADRRRSGNTLARPGRRRQCRRIDRGPFVRGKPAVLQAVDRSEAHQSGRRRSASVVRVHQKIVALVAGVLVEQRACIDACQPLGPTRRGPMLNSRGRA